MDILNKMRPLSAFIQENHDLYSFRDCEHWSILRCCWLDLAMRCSIPSTFANYVEVVQMCTSKYVMLFMLTNYQTTCFEYLKVITAKEKYIYDQLTGSDTIPTIDLFKVRYTIIFVKSILK